MTRFPEGFMFSLTETETKKLIQLVPRMESMKHSTVLPLAFTEYGVAMLSSVLRSEQAIQMNVRIIQAFIRLREWASSSRSFGRRLRRLESRMDGQDRKMDSLLGAMSEHGTAQDSPKRKIGFSPTE